MSNNINKRKINDLVNIVSSPNNIEKYDVSCNYYTELAITAVKQAPKLIAKISKQCSDYFEIGKIAIYEDPWQIKNIDSNYCKYDLLAKFAVHKNPSAIQFVNSSASSYLELCKYSLLINPEFINFIDKKSKDYYNIWNFTLKVCYKILIYIDKDDTELFPLVYNAIKEEPNAIYYVNSNLDIYPELSKLAYKINPESITNMDINRVDKNIVFEILKREPTEIKILSERNDKDFYTKACTITLEIDGSLIRYISCKIFENDLESYFDLVNIAQKTCFDVAKYSTVLNAMIKQNRSFKSKLLNSPNILGNNIFGLLDNVDKEYKELKDAYVVAIDNGFKEAKANNCINEYSLDDCPIRKHIKVNKQYRNDK